MISREKVFIVCLFFSLISISAECWGWSKKSNQVEQEKDDEVPLSDKRKDSGEKNNQEHVLSRSKDIAALNVDDIDDKETVLQNSTKRFISRLDNRGQQKAVTTQEVWQNFLNQSYCFAQDQYDGSKEKMNRAMLVANEYLQAAGSDDQNYEIKRSKQGEAVMLYKQQPWPIAPRALYAMGCAGIARYGWKRIVYPVGRANMGSVGKVLFGAIFARWIYKEIVDEQYDYQQVGVAQEIVVNNDLKKDVVEAFDQGFLRLEEHAKQVSASIITKSDVEALINQSLIKIQEKAAESYGKVISRDDIQGIVDQRFKGLEERLQKKVVEENQQVEQIAKSSISLQDNQSVVKKDVASEKVRGNEQAQNDNQADNKGAQSESSNNQSSQNEQRNDEQRGQEGGLKEGDLKEKGKASILKPGTWFNK